MAGPYTVTGSAASTSAWLPLDPTNNPFSVGFGARVYGTGNITYSVQHSFSLPDSVADAFDHSFASAQTASIDGNYTYPIAAMRLVVSSVSGNAWVRMNVLQGGKTR